MNESYRSMEKKYTEMKLTYRNLVKANVELVDENKDLRRTLEDILEIVREDYGQDLSSLVINPPRPVKEIVRDENSK